MLRGGWWWNFLGGRVPVFCVKGKGYQKLLPEPAARQRSSEAARVNSCVTALPGGEAAGRFTTAFCFVLEPSGRAVSGPVGAADRGGGLLWPRHGFPTASALGGPFGGAAQPVAGSSLPPALRVPLYYVNYGTAHDTHSALEI